MAEISSRRSLEEISSLEEIIVKFMNILFPYRCDTKLQYGSNKSLPPREIQSFSDRLIMFGEPLI